MSTTSEPSLFPVRNSLNTKTLALPVKPNDRVVCGKTLVEWEYAVLYVHDKKNRYNYPTHLYFSFVGKGPCLTTEVCEFVDQWTFYFGQCLRLFKRQEQEFKRARKMAIQVVETYRSNYMDEHGQPPNPLCLQGTLDPVIGNAFTKKINLRIRDDFRQMNLELPKPSEPAP